MARQRIRGLAVIGTRTYFAPKLAFIRDEFHPQGILCDVSPRPGRTYLKAAKGCGHAYSWPPVGRGRGESLTSARRIEAKLRAYEALEMYQDGHTFETIAHKLGFKDRSGPWRAIRRLFDRADYDRYASK